MAESQEAGQPKNVPVHGAVAGELAKLRERRRGAATAQRFSSAPTHPASPISSMRSASSTTSQPLAAASRKPSGSVAVCPEYAPWQPADTRTSAVSVVPWAMMRASGPLGVQAAVCPRQHSPPVHQGGDRPPQRRGPPPEAECGGREPTRKESRKHILSRSTSTRSSESWSISWVRFGTGT